MATGSYLENDMDIKDCRDCKHHSYSRSTYWPKLFCHADGMRLLFAPINRMQLSKEDMVCQETAKNCPDFQKEKQT